MRLVAATLLMMAFANAEDFRKLPDWARPHAEAASRETPPAEAEAWVLLDRTELAYTGNGEVRTRKLRLVRILTERGRGEGAFMLAGLGGSASQIKKLKGWNLKPDGDLVKLDQDAVVTLDSDLLSDEVSTGTRTQVVLDQVEKGSLVAFESLEVFRHPMGPSDGRVIMQYHPVRRFELDLARREGWFGASLANVQIKVEPRHFEPWIKPTQIEQTPGMSFLVKDIPPLPRHEGAHPNWRNTLPWLMVRFSDPGLAEWVSQDSWDAMATGTYKRYDAFLKGQPLPLAGADAKARMQSLHAWMQRELSYRQVYLAPERGWVPERPEEVMRKRFGDCKDLATFLMAQARKEGLEVSPVLARIVDGKLDPDEPVSHFAFNHVLAAVKLDKSWGFPGEVDTPKGRFLLMDPTSPLTPLGWLPSAHRGRRLLICTAAGAAWAEVPTAACGEEEIALRLKGKVDLKGDLEAEFHLVEKGNAYGLRGIGAFQGKGKLKEFVLRALEDLPPTGTLDLVDSSDPFQLERPFEVRLKLRYPQGLRKSGAELSLMPWGMVRVPGMIQKPGMARRYPVLAGSGLHFRFEAEVEVPWALTPILPNAQVQSPWRQGIWKAEVKPEGGAHLLRLEYEEQQKGAFFDFDKREEGVEAWKKDRNAVRRIRQDGLVFRVSP